MLYLHTFVGEIDVRVGSQVDRIALAALCLGDGVLLASSWNEACGGGGKVNR